MIIDEIIMINDKIHNKINFFMDKEYINFNGDNLIDNGDDGAIEGALFSTLDASGELIIIATWINGQFTPLWI